MDENTVRHQYIDENKSISDLMAIYGKSKKAIQKYLYIHKIVKQKQVHNASDILSKELFIEELFCNHLTMAEISSKYNIGIKALRSLKKKYGIAESKEMVLAKSRETMIERYGADSSFKSPEILEKIKKNNLERYGTENPGSLPDNRQKSAETILRKYGVENISQSEEIKQKKKKTLLRNYGVTTPLKSEEIRNKAKETSMSKYGVEHPTQSDIVKCRIKHTQLEKYGNFSGVVYSQSHLDEKYITIFSTEENLKEFLESFQSKPTVNELCSISGYSESVVYSKINSFGLKNLVNYDFNKSKYEDELVKILSEHGIANITRHYRSEQHELDVLIPSNNIGIEFNGSYWHSEAQKPHNYHQSKSMYFESKGILAYHIYEYEWLNQAKKEKILSHLLSLLGINDRVIYARKCVVKEIMDKEIKNLFLEENHIQGADRCKLSFGLYYNDELVSIATFTKPRYNSNYTWELSRLCSKSKVSVVGGASKLLKYFMDSVMKTGESLISYSSLDISHGDVYNTIGFEYVGITKPGYVWWKTGTDIKTRYQISGKNEIKTMTADGYLRIFNSGNKIWKYEKR